MWYIVVGFVFMIVGFLMARSAIEHALKKEGYIIMTNMDKKSGHGRYKIIDIKQKHAIRKALEE